MALDDSKLRDELLNHALAILGRRLRDRPTTDRTDAAGVAFQETCVRALEKRHTYNPDLPVGPWLHGIMNNVLWETVRGVRRLPAQELEDRAAWEELAVDLTPDVAETVLSRLDSAGFMAKLPSEHRQVIELRFFEGLSHEEIACRMGVSPGNARVRLCRAVNAMKAVAVGNVREDLQ